MATTMTQPGLEAATPQRREELAAQRFCFGAG
jgi:hypothetical protein